MPPFPAAVWELQEGQTLAQNTEGIFCIKFLSIVYRDMGFFYAFKVFGTSQPAIPDVVATSLLEVDGGSIQKKLPVQVESLGYLGTWNAGIVHVQWIDRPEQVITLTATLTGNTPAKWSLQPLKQGYQPHEARNLYISTPAPDEPGSEEIEFYGPVLKYRVAFLRLHKNGQPVSEVTPIFFRIPRTHEGVQAILLSQEEYLSFTGPLVNATTFHTEGSVRLEEAQPVSIAHPRKMRVSPIPAPLFEHVDGMEWPFGHGGGGGEDMAYWHGVLKADVEIAILASHYASQFIEAKWSRIEEQQSDRYIWETWTFQDENDANWKGLFFILKNPEVERQYVFYARADRVTEGY